MNQTDMHTMTTDQYTMPNYGRIDTDEAHYVHLAGDQYIGFISKQLGNELVEELAVAANEKETLHIQWQVKYEQTHELWNIDNCRNNDRIDGLVAALERSISDLQYFIDRCENGTARSITTQNRYRESLVVLRAALSLAKGTEVGE